MSLHTRGNESSVTEEELSAFADGELVPARAKVIAVVLHKDARAAEKVFDYWRQSREVQQQLDAELEFFSIPAGVVEHSDSEHCAGKSTRESVDARTRSAAGPWIQGAAACALLVFGIWLGQAANPSGRDLVQQVAAPKFENGDLVAETGVAYPKSQAEPQAAEPLALMPVSGKALEPLVANASDNSRTQESPGLVLEEPAASVPPSARHIAPAPDSAIVEPDVLPKSQHLIAARQEMVFIGADGTEMLLIQIPAGEKALAQWESTGLDHSSGMVQWVTGERLFVLSGNTDAAHLFAVALAIQKNMSTNDVMPQPAESEVPADTAGFLASAAPWPAGPAGVTALRQM